MYMCNCNYYKVIFLIRKLLLDNKTEFMCNFNFMRFSYYREYDN